MTFSPRCLDLIKSFESLQLEAYRCPAGVLTIGYGHTHGVYEGMTITPSQAEGLLLEDAYIEQAALNAILPHPVSQGQFDALVSLAFNLEGGARSIPHKAPKLWQAIRDRDDQEAARQFLDINKGGGKVLAGLTRRRQAEADLFLPERVEEA